MRKSCRKQVDRNQAQLKKLVARHNALVLAIAQPPGDGMTITEAAALRGDLPWQHAALVVEQRRTLV